MQLYFCLELINMIYPVLKSQSQEYQAQINILHETLFVLTDFGGGSQINPLIDMLLLQSFSMLQSNLFRVEFKRRLPRALTTILKPKTIEECPGLNYYATDLLLHIKSHCLHYMAHDLIKTCAGLIKPSTRITEAREATNVSANPVTARE